MRKALSSLLASPLAADQVALWRRGFLPRLLAIAAILSFTTALAQETADDEADEGSALVDADTEVVVVTGSRLKRSTYTSVAPLQIITAEVAREAGLVDAGDIIQESPASAGQQIDLTFHGFVLDDGPGSVTANIRGLGSARTLVMINGRRVAPAGVEGAPSSPSLDVIPGLLVQNYDQLLDGASSVYGSDAVAGVVNAILRKDFDGFEFEAFPRYSEHGAGREAIFAGSWGRNFDRGFIGIGAQYSDIEAVTRADRPWTAGCEQHWEVDEGYEIRTKDVWYEVNYGMEMDECNVGLLAGRVFIPGTSVGSIYFTEGYSNGGWGNFSESSIYGFGVDGDGDGQTDINFRDYDLNGREQFAYIRGPRTLANAMAYGEYTIPGRANATPYFEVLYTVREYDANFGVAQFFPDVPARNPYNLCNPEGAGVDCGLAQDEFFSNPNFITQFGNRWQGLCASFGIPLAGCTPAVFGLLGGPSGPIPTLPIVAVRGDRNRTDTEVSQWRFVTGISGDMPFLNVGSLYDWTFDVSVTHSIADGTAHRMGIREDRYNLSVGAFSSTNTPCENDTGEVLDTDVAPGCVAVNMFAPSLYRGVVGDFATPAERSYLFDSRDFRTEYEQTTFTAYVTGSLFELPGGPISAGAGIEYRVDDIQSIPDNVARDGLFFGFFSDGGAVGDKYTREAFGEVELPLLLATTPLSINLSARWTDDEFYGGAWTGAAKLGWNPIDSLLLRATWGTSYRAPNLRELFLQAQTGFTNVFDPCLLPGDAINDLTDVYDPSLDQREAHILSNCRANGVDPTIASNNGQNVFSVEVAAGGQLDLDEETSDSLSLGFAWEQPFTNAFDLQISGYYYKIDIEGTIIEPSAQFIVNDCYLSETGNSAFCNRIQRDADLEQPFINYIDRGFINRDRQTVRGVDVNVSLGATLTILDRPVDVEFDSVFHRQIEFSTLFTNDQGVEDFGYFHREIYFPELKASMGMRVSYDRWRLAWRSRFHGRIQQDVAAVDDWGHIDSDPSSDTCFGPPDDVLCRDVGEIGNYWLHNVSATYEADTWSAQLGARNVFDEPPPLVDSSEVASVNNVPLGAGYDILGRVLWLGVTFNIGGTGN